MIKLSKVSKFYYSKGMISTGITKVNLELNIGEFVAVTGESGSGKSTLLNVISGLDSYDEGEMYINGEETSHYVEKEYEEYRKKYIGNIFQSFNLINSYTVYENIELVLLLNGHKRSEVRDKVNEIIKEVELTKYKNTKVSKLSGGQKQRVGIARCLAKETPIILADEPTGNLDSKSAVSILKLLHKLSKDKLVIVVTHNYEQIEEFVTRKITMHDGKITEDVKIKNITEDIDVKTNDYKETPLISKIRLGLRNTFNIKTKFILMMLVYIFVVLAVSGTYAAFKQIEYENARSGYSNYFSSFDIDKRIILKKTDGSLFTSSDYEKIEKVKNVDKILKNDLIYDTSVNYYNDSNFFFGHILPLSLLKNDDLIGEYPTNDNEAVILGNKNDYTLNNYKDTIIGSEVVINDYIGNDLKDYNTNKIKKIKITGIIFDDDMLYDTILYVTDNQAEEIAKQIYLKTNNMSYMVGGKLTLVEENSTYHNIVSSPLVNEGEAYISLNMSYNCPNYTCLNQNINIKSINKDETKEINLIVKREYTYDNISTLLNVEDPNAYYDEAIYINPKDYEKLFISGFTQASVFVKNDKEITNTLEELRSLDYDAFYVLDGIDTNSILRMLRIVTLVCIIFLVVVLFFISYFVIKLILKSRNVYWSTIRMLGSSRKTIKNLLNIEMLTISNLTFIIFISLVTLIKLNIIKISFLNNISTFLTVKNFIVIYLIITLMSYLTSARYRRKLFKNTLINAYKEEV